MAVKAFRSQQWRARTTDHIRGLDIHLDKESFEHKILTNRLDDVLTLADRVLWGLENKNSAIINLREAITDKKPYDLSYTLFHSAEKWIKYIANVLHKDKSHQKGLYNLFSAMMAVDILPKEMINASINPDNEIWKSMSKWERGILITKEVRNVEAHDHRSIFVEYRNRFPILNDYDLETAPTAFFIGSVIKEFNLLQNAMSGLVLREFHHGNRSIDSMLRCMQLERHEHLKHFQGRSKLLENLHSIRKSVGPLDEPRIIFLTGLAASGKSAIIAKWTDELSSFASSHHESEDTESKDTRSNWSRSISQQFREERPWLPGCLIHLGKKGLNGEDLLRSLLVQASSLTMEFDSAAITQILANNCEKEHLRNELSSMMFDIARERGTITVVIDAADEMLVNDPHALSYLPSELPSGTLLAISVRPGIASERLRNSLDQNLRERIETIDINYASADEIGEILEIDDDNLLSRWERQTGGCLLSIKSIKNDILHSKSYDNIIGEKPKGIILAFLNEWKSIELLPFLAILCISQEYDKMLSWEIAISWAKHLRKTNDLSKYELRDVLSAVSSQVIIDNESGISLSHAMIQEYVIPRKINDIDSKDSHFTKTDIEDRFIRPFIEFIENSPSMQAKFWTDGIHRALIFKAADLEMPVPEALFNTIPKNYQAEKCAINTARELIANKYPSCRTTPTIYHNNENIDESHQLRCLIDDHYSINDAIRTKYCVHLLFPIMERNPIAYRTLSFIFNKIKDELSIKYNNDLDILQKEISNRLENSSCLFHRLDQTILLLNSNECNESEDSIIKKIENLTQSEGVIAKMIFCEQILKKNRSKAFEDLGRELKSQLLQEGSIWAKNMNENQINRTNMQ
ncbi:MAG: ATP-binding protein [Candidatus Sericytochromatia bacterium]|nr:ATP-binding protein [Candidatus Sericytochromatia bacterium]